MSELNEDSEELRALALRFFSFNEEFKAKRTAKYMELSIQLKEEMEMAQKMVDALSLISPFDKIEPPNRDARRMHYKHNVLNKIRKDLNEYSCQVLFDEIMQVAKRKARWNDYDKRYRLPSAEAAAWLVYFTKVSDIKENMLIPNDNWYKYYREHFGPGQHKQ